MTPAMALDVLNVEVDSDEGCFELPEWRELWMRDSDRHVFATSEWNRLWWELFGPGKELLILTMRRGDDPAAIVPLYRKAEGGRRILRFLGGIDLTDYLGPICSLDDRDDVADALVGWLETTDVEWDELDAHNMPVPFGFADYLVERADARGFSFVLDQEETSAILVLPGAFDVYLENLDSKQRRELKRKRRRFLREAPDARFRTATEETLDRDLKHFVELHRRAQGHKGRFMRPETATFFERVAEAFMPSGWLRLDFLEIADQPVASTFSFQLDQTFYLYNSAYEPDFARLSPGVVLVSMLVERAIEEKVARFDFLRGPERYKFQLGGQAVPLNNVRVLKTEDAR